MRHEHQRRAPTYTGAYERRNDNASDCLQGQRYSLADEIDIGGYCLDRLSEAPRGAMVHLAFDVCPTHWVD